MKTYTPQQIGRTLEKIEAMLKQRSEIEDWVPKKRFMEITGLDTEAKIKHFLSKHPELARAEKVGGLVKEGKHAGRTVNRGFIFNIKGWYELHKPLIETN